MTVGSRWSRRLGGLLATLAAGGFGAASDARAAAGDARDWHWRCRSPWSWRQAFAPDAIWTGPASAERSWLDKTGESLLHRRRLANGVVWGAAYAGVALGADPPDTPRWTEGILFDDDFRDGLRIGSSSGREAADGVSTALQWLTGLAPLVFDAGLKTRFLEGDCDAAFELAADWLESFTLTLLLTEVTKVAVGRERPFGDRCSGIPPPDADCNEETRRKSFFSGHASTAAVGAGLVCKNSVRRRVWGSSLSARAAPCGLAIGGAIAAGLLRVSADKHWSTDVIVGWAIGGLVGFFDVPGPVDLLRFRYRNPGRGIDAVGMVLPLAVRGGAGVRVVVSF